MYHRILPTITVLFAGLMAGAVSQVWWINRWLDDPALYVAYKQVEISALTPTLVPLGLLTIGLALVVAVQNRRRPARLTLMLVAALCLMTMGLLTRFALFPLNDQILAWSPQAPPADWRTVREQWETAHSLRTVAGLAAFALLLIGALLPERQTSTERTEARADPHSAAVSSSV
jgi:uncharacterized membrane protein